MPNDERKQQEGSYLILWVPNGHVAQGYHWSTFDTRQEAEQKLSGLSHGEFQTSLVFKATKLEHKRLVSSNIQTAALGDDGRCRLPKARKPLVLFKSWLRRARYD